MALYFPLFRALPFFKEIRDEVFVEHVALPENGLDGKGWKFRMLATVGGRSEVEFSDTTPLATSKVVEQICELVTSVLNECDEAASSQQKQRKERNGPRRSKGSGDGMAWRRKGEWDAAGDWGAAEGTGW